MNGNTPDEINLMDYIQVLRKRKWLIILGTLVFVIAAAIISLLMPKIYRGEAIFRIQTFTAKEMVSIIGKLDKEKIKQVFTKTYNSIDSIKLSALRDSGDKFQLII